MIKKIFIILFTIGIVFSSYSFTQAQSSQCSPLSSSNYPICCPSNLPGMATSCANYKSGVCSTNPNDPICQTIRGGGQNTNPTNSVGQTIGTIAPTPATSSQALKSCSAIAFDSLLDILIWLKCVIGAAIIPLIFTLAFLYFLWGMVMFIRGADDVKKREESKKFIYWGIIGLTVMVGVWGIVKIVTTTFGLGNTVPQLQTKDNCLTTSKTNPCK